MTRQPLGLHGITHASDGSDPIPGVGGAGLPVPPWTVNYVTGEVTGNVFNTGLTPLAIDRGTGGAGGSPAPDGADPAMLINDVWDGSLPSGDFQGDSYGLKVTVGNTVTDGVQDAWGIVVESEIPGSSSAGSAFGISLQCQTHDGTAQAVIADAESSNGAAQAVTLRAISTVGVAYGINMSAHNGDLPAGAGGVTAADGTAYGIRMDVSAPDGTVQGIELNLLNASTATTGMYGGGITVSLNLPTSGSSPGDTKIPLIVATSTLKHAAQQKGLAVALTYSGTITDTNNGGNYGVTVDITKSGGSASAIKNSGIQIAVTGASGDPGRGLYVTMSGASLQYAAGFRGGPVLFDALSSQPGDPSTFDNHPGSGDTLFPITGGGGASLYLWNDSGTFKLVANVNGTKTILATG